MDDIFIRAALHGDFTMSSTSWQPQQESKNQGSQRKHRKKKLLIEGTRRLKTQ